MKLASVRDRLGQRARLLGESKRRTQGRSLLAAILILFSPWAAVYAGTAEDDWQAVVALDSGPGVAPTSADVVGNLVVNHLARQEKTLRTFLAAHPKDSHAFEAQLRLARLFQIRADIEGSEKLAVEATRLLDSLEKTATPEQRPEVEFARIARQMRALHRSDGAQCEELLAAARRFQGTYPNDRRVAALLTEVATLFDSQPKTKETLLEDALAVAKEPDLRARITDDLKRLHFLGQVPPLTFTSVDGHEIGVDSFLGHPVFVIFFGAFSAPSMTALGKLQQAVAELPTGSVRVVGVSLDDKRETLAATLKTHTLAWSVGFDGKGWESPLVRSLGVNTLPTVWLLDAHGRLRSLNALEGSVGQARQLLQEK